MRAEVASRQMTEPILRATGVGGEVYDDPSEDALYMFMEDMQAGASALRVERLEEGRDGEWALVTRKENGLYEFESDQHLHYVSSFANVHDFLTRWAFDLPG
jgi:hypothetical protein